jgi:hypothetical protein
VRDPAQSLTAATARYYYDHNYRWLRVDYLTVAPFFGETDAWEYDGVGNRLSSSVNGAEVPYTYERPGER